ncbi:MAG TPA: DUF4180 domain-containing protein [Negativicutes bacterium]|nr:DUF4180 domain-containing protein [Negativicutes bacterium]
MDSRVSYGTNGRRYLECTSSDTGLTNEKDALELVSACFENDTDLLLLDYSVLSVDFFRLDTGVAGAILQKLINYRIKTAAVIPSELIENARFREMALETNKGMHFRIFDTREEAVGWLTGIK